MVEMNQKQIDFLIKMIAYAMTTHNPRMSWKAEGFIKERFYALSGDVE